MELKNWNMVFYKRDGYGNRNNVIKSLSEYLGREPRSELRLDGSCRITGEVYGHQMHAEGSEILTSEVSRIVRTQDAPTDTEFEFYTRNGSCYHLSLREMSISMRLMLDDWFRTCTLDQRSGHYRNTSKHDFTDFL